MASMDEHILRSAKEIIVKFIEVGRVSPTNFSENFKEIYTTVHTTVTGVTQAEDKAPAQTITG